MAEFRLGNFVTVQGDAQSVRGVNIEAVAPDDNDILVYDAATTQWRPEPPGGSGGPPSGPAGGQLGGTYPSPDVRGVRETSGPTELTIGAIGVGQVLTRVGATIVGTAAGADQLVKVTAADTTAGYLNTKITPANGLQEAVINPGAIEELQIAPIYGTSASTICQGNDSRLPTTGEKAALAGTAGPPGVANEYVTSSDPRMSDTRAPEGAASGQLGGSYPSPDVRGIRTTAGGGTLLTIGDMVNDQMLVVNGVIVEGVPRLVISNAVPVSVGTAVGVPGVSPDLSASDHRHQVQTAPAEGIGAGNSEGVSAFLARADHDHLLLESGGSPLSLGAIGPNQVLSRSLGAIVGIPRLVVSNSTPLPIAGATGVPGISEEASRSDHQHEVIADAPLVGIGAGNLEGISPSLARSDHDHAIHETGGQDLTVGAVPDQSFLQRQGTALVGFLPWQMVVSEHFVSSSADTDELGKHGWRTALGGGGASVTITGATGAPGVVALTSGTAGNGFANVNLGATGFESVMLAPSQETVLRARVRIRTSISAADLEAARIGSFDNLAADGAPTNGWGIKAEPGTSANWILWARNAGSESIVSHGSAALAVNTWFDLLVTATTTSVSGSVNGVAFGSAVSSNIPAGVLGPACKIQGNGGTGAIFDVDYYFLFVR